MITYAIAHILEQIKETFKERLPVSMLASYQRDIAEGMKRVKSCDGWELIQKHFASQESASKKVGEFAAGLAVSVSRERDAAALYELKLAIAMAFMCNGLEILSATEGVEITIDLIDCCAIQTCNFALEYHGVTRAHVDHFLDEWAKAGGTLEQELDANASPSIELSTSAHATVH